MEISKDSLVDKSIWILTVLLLTSFSVNNNNLNGSAILLGITAIVVILMAYKNQGKIIYNIGPFQIAVAAFAAFSLVSSLWSIQANYAIEKGITIFEILICVTIFYWAFRLRKDPVGDLIKAIMWSGFCLVIYTFVFYGTSVVRDVIYGSTRLSSAFDNVNTIGFLCAISINIAVFYVVHEKKILYAIMCIPSFVLLLACGSRKALIIVGLGIFLIFFFKAIGEKRITSFIRFIAIIIIGVFVIRLLSNLPVFDGINQRMEGLIALLTGKGKVDHSAWVRQQYILLGIEVFKKHPIVGIGMGNVRIVNQQILGDNCYLHNNFAELLANGGILGFGLFYYIYIYVIKRMVMKRVLFSYYGQVITMLIVCLLLADYGLVSYYSKITYFFFALFFLFVETVMNPIDGR